MADWRVLTADLITGNLKAEVPFEGWTFGRTINAGATFTSQIGQDHEKATATNLDPARTAIYVERGNRIVWGGILWPLRRDMGSRVLQVEASDWVDWLSRRNIRATLGQGTGWTGSTDQFEIVRQIVDHLQAIQTLGIIVTSGNSGVTRTRVYHGYERASAGTRIHELARVINGFDYTSDTSRDNTTDEITRHIRLGYPRLGRRTNHVLTFTPEGGNVEDYSYEKDPKRMANQVDAVGAGIEDAKLIATAQDPNLWSAYPILDHVASHESVTQQATLQGHADSTLRERRLPLEFLQAKLKANALPSFSSWIPGDEVRVIVDDKAIQVDSFMRIISDEVTVSTSGDEQVTVTLQPPGASLD